ncbi:MAG: DUF6491 family protein [Gammaproteobacteria bacterium]
MKCRMLFAILPAAILTACAGLARHETDAQALARHMDYAGEPVEKFTYLGNLNGWRTLGRDRVLVYTGVNDAYLLTVAPPCNDLQFAQSIALTSTGHTVSRRFDSVLVGDQRCMITEIRPVDYGQMRQAAKEAGL